MKKIKKAIVKLINRLIIHTELQESVNVIERKLTRISQINHLLIPDVLPLSEKAAYIFQKICTEKVYEKTDLRISKSDLMFLFWLHQTGTIENALTGYFQSGLTQADSMRELLIEQGFNLQNIKLLDFASGHGRVSRYFKAFLPVENICISDIKSNAVEFQSKTFKYKGFTAPANPLLLNTENTFDFISVSSLFTHLNKDLFGKWIAVLGRLLNNGGILALSIHKIDSNISNFQYAEVSEEDLFPETEENLSGKNIYGITYLSLTSLNNILLEHLPFKFEIVDERRWGDSQYLISVKRVAI
jgi:ubiquinone/menaquinone biosynthesis C-methylase UbiE